MLKSTIIYILCTIALGSCSINQNSVTNSNTAQVSNVSNYSIAPAPPIEQHGTHTGAGLSAPVQASVSCKSRIVKIITKPKFNDETILGAKTQKEMINYLLLHIEQLDKTIDAANNNIRNINSQNSKNCG